MAPFLSLITSWVDAVKYTRIFTYVYIRWKKSLLSVTAIKSRDSATASWKGAYERLRTQIHIYRYSQTQRHKLR